MPIVPGINEREVNPDPANTPYLDIKTSGEAFGTGVGKSMGSLAGGLDTVATVAGQFDDRYQKFLQDPLKHLTAEPRPEISGAIDAAIDFRDGAAKVQNDYFSLGGKSAVVGLAPAVQQIDQLQDAARSTATPQVAQLADRSITAWGNITKGSLDRHAAAQQRVYDDDLDNAQVAQSRDAVGRLYNDDQNFLTQLHVALEARQSQLFRNMSVADPSSEGLVGAVKEARQATASDFVRARINGALDQGDVTTAQALYQRWNGDLLPADQRAVSHYLATSAFSNRLQQMTSQMMAISRTKDGRD